MKKSTLIALLVLAVPISIALYINYKEKQKTAKIMATNYGGV